MAFVDPFLLTMVIVLTLILIFFNIYFVAHYAHYADSAFGSSTACKALIIVAYMVAECQILMLPLDVQNTREETDFYMKEFWLIVFMTSLFLITIILPFSMFYYEADEEKDFKWRLCSAFKSLVIFVILVSCVLFPTYAFMRYAYIPVQAVTCNAATSGVFVDATDTTTQSLCITSQDLTLEITLGFQIYVIGMFTFLGWFLLCFFLGTGLIAIPFDLCVEWKFRPIPMKEDEFNRAKSELAKKVSQLITSGKKLVEEKTQNQAHRGYSLVKWRKTRQVKSEQHKFETNCMLAEKEFQRLDQVAGYKNKVEPCKYTCKLITGILFAGLSVIMLTHLFCYVALKVDGKTIRPFLNRFLENIQIDVSALLSSVLLIFFGYYLVLAALKGNVKFGLRFFFVSFYPIIPKETFVNSFVANAMIMNLWMFSMTQFMVQIFRGYMRGTQAALIFEVQVRYQQFYTWVFVRNFFIIFAIVWWFISLVFFILKPVEKINLGIQLKKTDLSSKQ